MKRLLPLLALALLSACILVDDFGTAWDQAKPDPCLSKIAQSLYYAEFRRDPSEKDIDQLARGWTLKGDNFLLLKKNPDDKGGRLYRFDVVHGIFERYRLVPTMRATFLHDYPNAPVKLDRDSVTLKTLNPETEAFLTTMVKQPQYWEAEDKTLYNTMRNPTCRFDDRDLTKDPDPRPQVRTKHDKK